MNYEGLKDVVVYELRILDLGKFGGRGMTAALKEGSKGPLP